MFKRLLGHARDNAVAYLALVLVVICAPTSAYAALAVRSGDIVDGQVKTQDLANDAVRSGKIANGQVLGPDLGTDAVTSGKIRNGQVFRADLGSNSVDSSKIANETVSGADVLESTLGQVPTALQGGLGRYGFSGSCDPESSAYVNCSVVQITLDKPARLMVVGTATAATETGTDQAWGRCRVGTTRGPIVASTTDITIEDAGDADPWENMPLVAVTDVFPAGTHSVGVDCSELSLGAVKFISARVTVVALSAG